MAKGKVNKGLKAAQRKRTAEAKAKRRAAIKTLSGQIAKLKPTTWKGKASKHRLQAKLCDLKAKG